MKKYFRKIAVISMITLGVFTSSLSFFSNLAYADPAGATTPSSPTQFEVSKYLKIDEGQSYLTENDKVNKKNAVIFFITRFITILTTIIGSFALLFIIIGGITLMVSHGNSNLQTKGKQMILYSVIGLVVAFSSLIIVSFVQALFFTL